jgi:hypothetical protein
MNEGASGEDLLTMRGGFAVVGDFIHACSIADSYQTEAVANGLWAI